MLIFQCPCCKKKSGNPREEGWKSIQIPPDGFGAKFCPECYDEFKDKDITWEDLKKWSDEDGNV